MIVNTVTTIEAPAENIWKTIRAYDNVERWNPLVTNSKISGTVEGSERICEVQFGDQKKEVVENLDLVDEENKTFKVSVVKGPPQISGQQSTFQVKSLSENKTKLLISTDVENDSNHASEGWQEAFQMMSQGLKKLHEKEVI